MFHRNVSLSTTTVILNVTKLQLRIGEHYNSYLVDSLRVFWNIVLSNLKLFFIVVFSFTNLVGNQNVNKPTSSKLFDQTWIPNQVENVIQNRFRHFQPKLKNKLDTCKRKICIRVVNLRRAFIFFLIQWDLLESMFRPFITTVISEGDNKI